MNRRLLHLFSIVLLTTTYSSKSLSQAQDGVPSYQWTYNYIATTLHLYRTTGRIATNLGLDGADYAEFLQILERFNSEFAAVLMTETLSCEGVHSEGDGQRTVAEESLQGIRSVLADRDLKTEYERLAAQFMHSIADLFGSFIEESLVGQAQVMPHNYVLPTRSSDQAEISEFVLRHCV